MADGASQSLREAVQRFAAEDVPARLRDKSRAFAALDKADYVQWMQLLHAKGWATAHWPEADGGKAWNLMQRFVFEDEIARQGLPWIIPFGVKYVGPVLCRYGTPDQKQRFLPPITDTSEWWAQGYSEPGAGSDLAAIKTTAERDGDDYIVNGQKVWTTYAQWADWIFCLVRTHRGERPQEGISFLLCDMNTPGITVRPIHTMDGHHHVNEVWFENVRVPAANRVGEEGEGWRIAKFLLQNERTAGTYVGIAWFLLERLRTLLAECDADAAHVRHFEELELRCFALETVCYRLVSAMMEGREDGAEASLMKIRATELHQDLARALVDVLGVDGIAAGGDGLPREQAGDPPMPSDAVGMVANQLYGRAETIYGGSTEIQRNIVAKAVLGL